jgi:hypothetical protein
MKKISIKKGSEIIKYLIKIVAKNMQKNFYCLHQVIILIGLRWVRVNLYWGLIIPIHLFINQGIAVEFFSRIVSILFERKVIISRIATRSKN